MCGREPAVRYTTDVDGRDGGVVGKGWRDNGVPRDIPERVWRLADVPVGGYCLSLASCMRSIWAAAYFAYLSSISLCLYPCMTL